MLDIVGARRAWRGKRPNGEWYNEQSELVAHAELLTMATGSLDLFYEWMDRGQLLQGRTVFTLVHRRSMTGRQLPEVICTGCGRARRAVHLSRGAWTCADCLGLVARATLLSERERDMLQLQQLQVHGRPPPVRGFRTWDAKRHKLAGLIAKYDAQITEPLRAEVQASVRVFWNTAFTDGAEVTWCENTDRVPPAALPVVMPWFGQY